MLTDLENLPEGTSVDADVCIVGAGPAGISLALRLRDSGLSVLLLEAGGEAFDADDHALYEAEVECEASDRVEEMLTETRARYLGGSSNLWAGWCRPFEPEDFEVRSWVPYSGWPFDRAALDPYYDAATPLVEVVPFQPTAAWEGSSRPPLPLDRAHLETRIWQFSGPTRFGTAYRADLEAATDVQVVLHANLVGVQRTGDTVDALEVRTLGGRQALARASTFVLACGGSENARLMLALGLGNELTGRFWMEHPHIRAAMELQIVGDLGLYSGGVVDEVLGAKCRGLLAVPGEVQAREALLNQAVMLRDVDEVEQDASSLAVSGWLEHTLGQVPHVTTGFGLCEQIPNPDSRITLSDATDALGMPRIHLDWRLMEEDWRSIHRSMELVAEGLGAVGIGRGRMQIAMASPWDPLSWGAHHMGATRMATSPEEGVVDANCRVHGLDNLYVAGSSVFPTGGAANPTLTIVAMSLRLADHLREVL